ncbi:MAG: hypothetical protein M3357_00690 [Actinomycetota bacterium]|nr:hypothetical protein [Actinomycetota bacterium]
MPSSSGVLIDDWLLVARASGVPVRLPRRAALHTTTSWYYRACRAAVSGAGGHLSGPFSALDPARQEAAIQALLALGDDVGLPDPRPLVPEMVGVHRRHPRLNLLNVEAAAAARLLDTRVLLSPLSARGVLPGVLEAEGVRWDLLGP